MSCPARSVLNDSTCLLEAGHDGPHTNGQISWDTFLPDGPAATAPGGDQMGTAAEAAAEADARAADEEEHEAEVVQLGMFEGAPFIRREISFGGAAAIPVDEDLKVGDEVKVELFARVTKAGGHDPSGKGKLTRFHTAVVTDKDAAVVKKI